MKQLAKRRISSVNDMKKLGVVFYWLRVLSRTVYTSNIYIHILTECRIYVAFFSSDVSVILFSKNFGMFSKLGSCLVLVVYGYAIIRVM